MNAIDFIKEKLTLIHQAIAGIRLTYAYDDDLEYHIVEVAPVEIYESNQQYMELEAELRAQFRERYPDEDILISEEEPYHDMSNVQYSSMAILNNTDKIRLRFSIENNYQSQYNVTRTNNQGNYSLAA